MLVALVMSASRMDLKAGGLDSGHAPAIAITGQDEELGVAEGDDGALGAVAVDRGAVSGAAGVIGAGKLDDVLRDGVCGSVGSGDVVNERRGCWNGLGCRLPESWMVALWRRAKRRVPSGDWAMPSMP